MKNITTPPTGGIVALRSLFFFAIALTLFLIGCLGWSSKDANWEFAGGLSWVIAGMTTFGGLCVLIMAAIRASMDGHW